MLFSMHERVCLVLRLMAGIMSKVVEKTMRRVGPHQLGRTVHQNPYSIIFKFPYFTRSPQWVIFSRRGKKEDDKKSVHPELLCGQVRVIKWYCSSYSDWAPQPPERTASSRDREEDRRWAAGVTCPPLIWLMLYSLPIDGLRTRERTTLGHGGRQSFGTVEECQWNGRGTRLLNCETGTGPHQTAHISRRAVNGTD